MIRIHFALIATILLFVCSCARTTAPTGGPKDTIPPALVNSFPRKGALNVNTRIIEMEFDETIALANAKEQIIITPDIDKKYDIVARKKKLTLKLENELQANTTYTFNFRDAVQDITEKNPSPNLKLAFSTGSYIDSLSIQGSITTLLQNKEVKDATVALYASDTFNIFKHRPVYFTKTSDKGTFALENLKNGTYHIYAFEDKNRNLIADSRNENFGFLSDSLDLSENIQRINIALIRLDSRPLKLTSTRPSNTYFNIRFAKFLYDYEILSPNNDTIYSTFGEDRANIRVYNTFSDRDSTAVQLLARDSINNTIDTTVYVKFQTRQATPEKFSFSLDQPRITARTGVLEAKGKFTKPVLAIVYDSILFHLDSATVTAFSQEDIVINNKTGEFQLRKQLPRSYFAQSSQSAQPKPRPSKDAPAPMANVLRFGKGNIISVESDSSAVIEQRIKPLTYDDTGVIIAAVETGRPDYIIQLLDKSYNIIQSFTNRKQVSFQDLLPGDYLLRAVDDRDADGKWSPGNFFNGVEPEPVYYYSNDKKNPVINLKANFELGPLLITF